ncbi:hypothetical protein BDZ97DRAFT_1972937, partial [Flammula alnicola]
RSVFRARGPRKQPRWITHKGLQRCVAPRTRSRQRPHRREGHQDGHLRLLGVCTSEPCPHWPSPESICGADLCARQDCQIVASNLLISPIQTTSYLVSMAVINGASSLDEVIKTVRAGFFSVIRISWIVSPLSMTIAQRFIPVELWVPFFNAIQFVLGTYFNVRVKQLRLAALKKEKQKKEDDSD